jgi:molybdopterin molybdotransferase
LKSDFSSAMITVEQALQLVEQHARPLSPRRVPLGEAAGLVLAEDIASDVDSPPHDKAMMDGYAVASSDRSVVRKVIEEIAAGAVPRQTVGSGQASRIMTGAPLPKGADAVIPVEQSELVEDGRVALRQIDPPSGQNVLPRGASVRAGDVVVRAGARLRPIELAILAEAGCAAPLVHPRPRLAVLATGNELVPVAALPAVGQIRNSNGTLLVAAAVAAGAHAVDLGMARDELHSLRDHVSRGLAEDVLVLSGGVSAGKFDLVPQVLEELGTMKVFHQVSLRPGRPLWFGIRDGLDRRTLVFGLPGNPVSSFVCFELFVRPALAALAGRPFIGLPAITARLEHDFDHKGGRAACLPARVTQSAAIDSDAAVQTVAILPWQGSADIATLAGANALARLPAEPLLLAKGAPLEILLI